MWNKMRCMCDTKSAESDSDTIQTKKSCVFSVVPGGGHLC